MLDAILFKLKELFASRIVYLSIVVIILFSILVGRMYSLQVLTVASSEGTTENDSS